MLNNFSEDLFIKKEERKECREFLNEIFMSFGLEKFRIIEKRIYYITKNLQFFKEFYFLIEQALNYKQENLIPKIQEKIQNSKWANHDLMRYFKPSSHLQVGHKLESIPDIEKINGEKEIRQYNLEEGKVCLIYIWSYFKPFCKNQLSELNKLYENNWEGNVKFLTLNLDSNRDNAMKFLKQLNLQKMEHFYIDIKKHPDHPIYKIGELYGFSTCILVNNDNIIDSCGHIYEIELKNRITLMLERNLLNSGTMIVQNNIDKNEKILLKKIIKNFESFTLCQNAILGNIVNSWGNNDLIENQYFQASNNSLINNTCLNSFNDLNNSASDGNINIVEKIYKTQRTGNSFTNGYTRNNENYNNDAPFTCDIKSYKRRLSKTLSQDIIITAQHLCEAKITLNKIFLTGNLEKNSISIYSGEVEYQCHNNDEGEILKLFNGIENISNVKFKKNIIETVEFFYGENCSCCNAYLYDKVNNEISYAQYYCPICDIYFCKDCGNELTNINSNKKLHTHFLYFLNNNTRYHMKYILKHNLENPSEMEFKYFLENKNFDYVVKDLKQHHHIKCDGCFSYPIKTYRWKCCNCEYKNVCEICMGIIERNYEPFASEILNNLELGGCDALTHVFMKIIFEAPLYK